MNSKDPWLPIQNELSTLIDDLFSSLPSDEYRPLHPLLEKFKQRVDAQQHSYPNSIFMTPEDAAKFIQIFRDIQTETLEGRNLQEVVKHTLSGPVFNQPELDVRGNLTQAGRDVIYQIFSNTPSPFQQERVIKVPVILLVMNSFEAKGLVSEACLTD